MQLIKIQKKEQYNIVHVHTPVASLFGRLLKLFYPKLKTIYTAHGYHFLKGGPKIGWLVYYPIEKVMAKFTDVTITINQEDYDITVKKLKPKKIYLMNGVGLDLSQYRILPEEENFKKRKELGLSEDDFVIIMIAELNENKNQIQLIKAMELLKDNYPNIKALIVGEGYKWDKLQQEVKSGGLNKQVQFLGFRSDVNELINISDIGVLLSYREGLPRNLMELIVCGKKIIGTNIRGCRDLITHEDIGELVNIGDVQETSLKIKKCFDDRNNFTKINQSIISQYDYRLICENLLKIYKGEIE